MTREASTLALTMNIKNIVICKTNLNSGLTRREYAMFPDKEDIV